MCSNQHAFLPSFLLTKLQLYLGVHPLPHTHGLQRRVTLSASLEIDLNELCQSQKPPDYLPRTGSGMSMWHNSGRRDVRRSLLAELLAKLSLLLKRIPQKLIFLPLDAIVIGYDSWTAITIFWLWEGEIDSPVALERWQSTEMKWLGLLMTSPSLRITYLWSCPL